jgi:hypothetical protein
LIRRVTVDLLNTGPSAVEPKRFTDDRESAPTPPLLLITTVICRPE